MINFFVLLRVKDEIEILQPTSERSNKKKKWLSPFGAPSQKYDRIEKIVSLECKHITTVKLMY